MTDFRFRPVGALILAAIVGALATLAPWGLVFILQVSALIVSHEGGHFFAARRCGMCATEFFAGFGPTVVSVRRGETTYGIKALPIGGYVKVVGMSASEEVDPDLEPRTYRAGSLPRRLAVVLAGPFMNLVAAVVIFAGVVAVAGTPVTVIGSDGSTTTTHERLALPAAMVEGVSQTVGTAGATLRGIAQFATAPFGTTEHADGTAEENRFLSPVGASQVTGWAAGQDLTLWAQFVALISISLAIFNLLPVPPLDGGHAVVAVVESALSKLRGRRVSVPKRATTALAYVTLSTMAVITAGSLFLDVTKPLTNPFGS